MKAKSGLMLLVICVSLVATVWPTNADEFELIEPIGERGLFELIKPNLSFGDELIDIMFIIKKQSGGYEGIGFVLVNRSDTAIAIDWNGCSFISPMGQASKILHEGVKYIDANGYTPPTTIPSGSSITDIAIPTSSVRYDSTLGWTIKNMNLYMGAEFGLYLSLTVGGELRGYDFRFRVKLLDLLKDLSSEEVPGEVAPSEDVFEEGSGVLGLLVMLALLSLALWLLKTAAGE